MMRTLGGAATGGLTGAAVGAGLGGAAGLAGGASTRGLVSQLRGRKGALGGVSRLGERQMHGMTGALPPEMNRQQAMKALRMGSVPKREIVEKAQAAAGKFRKIGPGGMEASGVKRLASTRRSSRISERPVCPAFSSRW